MSSAEQAGLVRARETCVRRGARGAVCWREESRLACRKEQDGGRTGQTSSSRAARLASLATQRVGRGDLHRSGQPEERDREVPKRRHHPRHVGAAQLMAVLVEAPVAIHCRDSIPQCPRRS